MRIKKKLKINKLCARLQPVWLNWFEWISRGWIWRDEGYL